jgi:sterol desaturase/sphingolipid hydroxylase (fatty acid hydroxylase superfamily)
MIGNSRRQKRKLSLSHRMQTLSTATQKHFENESFSTEEELNVIEMRAEKLLAEPVAEERLMRRRARSRSSRLDNAFTDRLTIVMVMIAVSSAIGTGAWLLWDAYGPKSLMIAAGLLVAVVIEVLMLVLRTIPRLIHHMLTFSELVRSQSRMRRDREVH